MFHYHAFSSSDVLVELRSEDLVVAYGRGIVVALDKRSKQEEW